MSNGLRNVQAKRKPASNADQMLWPGKSTGLILPNCRFCLASAKSYTNSIHQIALARFLL